MRTLSLLSIMFFLMNICTSCTPLEQNVKWGDFICQIDLNTDHMILKNDKGNLTLTTFYPYRSLYDKVIKIPDEKTLHLRKKNFIQQVLGCNYEKITLCILNDSFEAGDFTEIWTVHKTGVQWQEAIYNNNGTMVSIVVLNKKNEFSKDMSLQILNPENGCVTNEYGINIPKDVSGCQASISDDLNNLVLYDAIGGNKKIYFFRLDLEKKRYVLMNMIDTSNKLDGGKFIRFIKIDNNIAIISLENGLRTHIINRQIIICYDLNKNKTLFEYKFNATTSLSNIAVSQDRKYIALCFTGGIGIYKPFIRIYKINLSTL